MNLRSMGIAAILVLAGGAIGHAATSTSGPPSSDVLRSASELPGLTGPATPAGGSIFVASKDGGQRSGDDRRSSDDHRERGDKGKDDNSKDNHKGGKGRGGHDDGPNHA